MLGSRHDVRSAGSVEEALVLLAEEPPDVMITDLVMPGEGGLALSTEALGRFPDLAVIVMSGQGSLAAFMDLFAAGVTDYLRKPFTRAELDAALTRVLASRRLRCENARLRRLTAQRGGEGELLGDSGPMRAVRERIAAVADADTLVLVTGESGTGKEVVARSLHRQGRRRSGPFIAVHCGALAPGLVESELFGHVRGAFTGARQARAGGFEQAAGGTLFLDEVGTMPETVQVGLLRVLQSHRVQRVGESADRPIDARVVAATNEDLPALVAQGRFRQDLFYRIDVLRIDLPPLRDRREDIPVLAAHALEREAQRLGRRAPTLSQAALRLLGAHDWPGNVRELENVLQRALILAGPRRVLEASDLGLDAPRGPAPPGHRGLDLVECSRLPPQGLDLAAHLEALERSLLEQALERAGGVHAEAARLLGLPRTTLRSLLARAALPARAPR
jgi:DNA-binding NtrC family response regulator